MKKCFFLAALAIVTLGSCSKYDELEQIRNAGEQALTFTATTEGGEGTRVIYNSEEKRAEWEVGDKISINGKTYSAQEAGTTTTFETEGQAAEGPVYKAYFPAGLYDGTTATLPATQTYTAGKFNIPMYAQSTSTELHFKNLCAVLAIKVTSADINKLKSIKVDSDKKMSGTFTVDENNTAVIGNVNATNFVELESASALTLTAEGTTFYIAIPAQEYQYLNIFLSSDGNNYTQAMATKKATGIGALERSKIYNIDYKKNATKLWEGRFFVADCNVGATSENVNGGLYTWGGTKDAKQGYVDDHNTGSLPLSGEADTATKLWGDNWRMPKKEELEKLNNLGQWDATNKGLQCNSTDYPGNSVFLPADGAYYNEFLLGGYGVYEQGHTGYYWSSDNSTSAYGLRFAENKSDSNVNNYNSDYAFSVRAVLVEAKTPNFGRGKAWSNEINADVNWVQLWEGGPKFAEYNVGVSDGKAESYGSLYFWCEHNHSDLSYWNFPMADLTGDDLSRDTAYKVWGDKWRMPTKTEFEALLLNCESEWTSSYNNSSVAGRIFTGRGDYSDNSIFLPAGGYIDTWIWVTDEKPTEVKDRNLGGAYWSSTYAKIRNFSYALTFNNGIQQLEDKQCGHSYSMRPVLAD